MAFIRIEVDDDFINQLAVAIAKQNLVAGGVMPNENQADTQPTQDPWAGTDAQPAGQQSQGDPWAASANPTGSGTTGAVSEPPATPPAFGTFTIAGKNGNRVVVFGKQGAPPCNHGQPAVFTEFASGKKNWACALSATKRWKDKCEFTQWT